MKRIVFGVVFAVTATGCDAARAESSYSEACRSLGLCEQEVKPAVAIDLLVDGSRGSTGTRETLEKTLDAVLPYAADRPGSVVRAWALGKSVAETEVKAEQSVPQRAKGTEKAQRERRDRFIKSAKEFIAAGVGPTFAAEPVRRSPLAAAISKVAIADAAGLSRHVIVVTDGREVSELGDFECGILPTDARFLTLLRRRSLLMPGSLQGASVQLAFVQLKPIPARGCTVEIDRELRVRALWSAALKTAGATSVRMNAGPPTFIDESSESQTIEKGVKK